MLNAVHQPQGSHNIGGTSFDRLLETVTLHQMKHVISSSTHKRTRKNDEDEARDQQLDTQAYSKKASRTIGGGSNADEGVCSLLRGHVRPVSFLRYNRVDENNNSKRVDSHLSFKPNIPQQLVSPQQVAQRLH